MSYLTWMPLCRLGRVYEVCWEEFQVVKRGREYHGCGEENNMGKKERGKQYHLTYNIQAFGKNIKWEK